MFTLAHIAEVLGQPVLGDGSLTLHRAAEPAVAGPDDLALAMSPDYADALKAGQARAAILWDGADWESFGLRGAILVPRARLAMAGITAALDSGPRMNVGVHPSAIVEKDAVIGEGAAIGPLAVIGAGVRIGVRARIAAHVTIAEDALIGDDVLLMSGVRIGSRVTIGDRFIAQPNAVIGGDGFSFVTPEESGVERARKTLGDQGDISEQSVTTWSRGGASDIYSRIRDGEVVMGSPAVKMATNMAMYRALRRLPRALEQLASLRAIVMKKGLGDGNDDKT